MLNVIYSGRLKKDYRKCNKHGLNMNLLKLVVNTLAILNVTYQKSGS